MSGIRLRSFALFTAAFLSLSISFITAGTAETVLAADALPESAHPYTSNCDETWNYTYPDGADYLKITFSEDTMTERGYDILTVTDAAGLSWSFSGSSLAGNSLYLEGGSFTINLKSDGSKEDYGFYLNSVEKISEAVYAEPHFIADNGTLIYYSGQANDLTIPSQVGGQTITAIAGKLFEGNEVLRTVTIPDTVTSIEYQAFASCKNLEEVDLGSGLLQMDYACFSGCSALREIDIPDTVTSIGPETFMQCTKLERVEFSENLEYLGQTSFAYCSSLKEVVLPAAITSLVGYEFMACTGLEKVTFLSGTAAIGSASFHMCEKLQNIDGYVTSITGEHFAFTYCDSLLQLTFADDMGELSEAALEGFTKILPLVVSVSENSAVYTQLKEYNNIVYVVRETGETNEGTISIETVRGKMEYIISNYTNDDMTDYEKVKALHDWLCLNADYDDSLTIYGPEGVLLQGTGVCQSYTDAMKGMLDLLGIENDREIGTDHIWNMVRLDGEWYHVDVTWDDNPNTEGGIQYDFFCVSNYALEGVESHECFNKTHYASAYQYNYYYRQGNLDTWITRGNNAIAQSVKSGMASFAFDLAYDSLGIKNRTVLLILQDQDFAIDGVPVKLDFEYGSSRNYGYAMVSVHKNSVDFVLPAGLSVIEDEAFMNAGMQAIIIPANVYSIGERAFAGCGALSQVTIPAACTQIADSAFDSDPYLLIFCKEGSAAEAWAAANGRPYVIE